MSWFDLKQSAAELPSLNQGISKLTYEQVSTTRDVSGDNFPKGSIHIRWEVSGVRWWIPSKSVIRLRVKIQDGAGNQPLNSTDIAPNMGMCGALFQSMEFRIADKTVSRVSDYVAQVDALTKRLKKSKSWMDGIGDSLEQWNPDFETRQNQITKDGFISDGKTSYVEPTGIPAGVFGFDVATPNQVALAAATGIMTFSVNGGDAINILNNQVISVGDRITIGAITYEVTRVIDALNVNVITTNGVLANFAAQNIVVANLFHPVQNQNNNISRNRNGIELIWQPPLSIFSMDDNTALPAGKYELILNPQTSSSYQRAGVQSLLANKTPDTDFKLVVDDLYFQMAVVDGPSVDNVSYFLSLEETRCQAIDAGDSKGQVQKNFDVSPSTYALTAAWQSQDLENTLNSQSKFKFPAPALSGVPSGELALGRFYIQYDGQNKPSPDADPDYVSPNGFINSRYAETLLYSNAYFEPAGESLNDWLDRGPYLFFAFPKDGSSESTRVNVKYTFNTAPGADAANLLLFDHHKKMILVNIVAGRVIDIIEQDG